MGRDETEYNRKIGGGEHYRVFTTFFCFPFTQVVWVVLLLLSLHVKQYTYNFYKVNIALCNAGADWLLCTFAVSLPLDLQKLSHSH